MVQSGWVEHEGVRLHYLRAGNAMDLAPLIYIPGSLGNANDFRDEMRRLSPRRTVAISPRGLGGSSAPEAGYSFERCVGDLEAVLENLSIPPSCVMAFSRGVPVAVRYVARNPNRVVGLILLDYPARYSALSPEWLERALAFARERDIPEHVVQRMQLESEPIELWDELQGMKMPVLIVKGGKSPAISDEDIARFRKALLHVRIEVFEDSGHDVYRPDYDRFMRLIEGFLQRLD